MKKILYLFTAVLIAFTFSCQEDGDWVKDNSLFGITIEAEKDFIEKSVGEIDQIELNVKTTYNFSTIKTYFKYKTDLNGVLKLDDKVLEPNVRYELEKPNNTFEYIGNEAGVHNVKIEVENDREQKASEEFKLTYSVSDFTVSQIGGEGDVYQGQETQYLLNIVPEKQDRTGYSIIFKDYIGDIKFNGVPVELNKEYPLHSLEKIAIVTKTKKSGRTKLLYTIKNKTVTKDLEIQQNILARQINIENIQISKNTVKKGEHMFINGIIKKSPIKDNNTIYYRTWVSSATDGNTKGISSTENKWVEYSIGNNNNFKSEVQALSVGNYTLNIQIKDEFGNESDIETFEINVQKAFSFTETPNIKAKATNLLGNIIISEITIKFIAETLKNNKITNFELILDAPYYISGQEGTRYFLKYSNFSKENILNFNKSLSLESFEDKRVEKLSGFVLSAENLDYTLKVYNDRGEMIEYKGKYEFTK